MTTATASKWIEKAQEILDADPSDCDLALAIAYLQVEMGDLDPSEVEIVERECICSAEQLDRGGFKGGCPVHG